MRYRRLMMGVWGDDKFQRLSPMLPSAQSLWLYLLLGPHTTHIPGLFVAGTASLAEALRWDQLVLLQCWTEIERQGMAHADWAHRLVWLPNGARHNPPQSPNVVRSWATTWGELPMCALKQQAHRGLRADMRTLGPAWVTAFDEAIPAPGRKKKATVIVMPARPTGRHPASRSIRGAAKAAMLAGTQDAPVVEG